MEPHMANFTIGQQVENFGITATVVGFQEASGDLIIQAPRIGKWIADPGKCKPVDEPVRYRDGLVIFG